MNKTLGEIAQFVGGEVVGDKNLIISGLSGIKEAKGGDLTFVANSKYFSLVEATNASAILVPTEFSVKNKAIVRTENPSLAFAKIASDFINDQSDQLKGIHKTAIVANDAKIGKNVYIGPYVVVQERTVIGDDTAIHAGCFVGHDTSIAKGCKIYPNATIRERISIGNNVIIHSGTVIGSDGFGFVNVEGVHEKIPQIGTVVIEDNVEIGANVTVDRARFDKTFIGRGTKIDNLVQIAHNVIIGENCIIIAQVGISGSSTVGKNAILAGQVGVVGHLTIGEGAIIAAQSGVSKSILPHEKVFGSPAKPHKVAKRIHASVQRLPQYIETLKELEKKVQELEKRL